MNQIKFYRLVIAGLLLLNILVLAFFLLIQSEPRPDRAPRPAGFQTEVPRLLELDSTQQLTFDDLAEQHNQQVAAINLQQQELLLPFFESIADSSLDFDNELIQTQFQQLELEKLVVTRQHFIDVKNILYPQQFPLFKDLMRKITDRVVGKRNKNRPRPKDFK
ncbi:MAG: hypothetical protein AAF927_03890 [Bacteroidota bacterium]